MSQINKLLDYLNAGKRVYLSKKLREKLDKYKEMVEEFINTLDADYSTFHKLYYLYLKKVAENFYLAPLSIDIYVDLRDYTEFKIRNVILSQQVVTLRDDIMEVCYVLNDEPENYISFTISISGELRNIWGQTEYGLNAEDYVKDSEELKVIDLLEHVFENTKDEKEIINGILDKMNSNVMLIELKEYIDEMHNDLIKEINKTTR